MLLAGVALFIAYAQQPGRQKASPTVKQYTRPAPVKPIKPLIPQENRNVGNRFFLEQADLLYSTDNDTTGRQVVSGNVIFRKQGMLMYCDSAYYYPATSSLDAFGNVRMVQGDTVKVTADYATYDGLTEQAQLRSLTAGKKVVLEHTSPGDHTRKTLTTDVLDYYLPQQEARYVYGGRLLNRNLRTGQEDTLTSIVGTYNTGTKLAEVTEDVYMRNRTSRLRTTRLLYHTDTGVVDIVERTSIKSGVDSINTTAGNYNSRTGNALLSGRSFIAHRDSAGNVTTLEGDSIVYDNVARESRAYMFTDHGKHAAPMVLTDTAHHSVLIGGFGYYNDSTKIAFAERYPLLKEYSRGDTIFLRADKIFTQVYNYGVKRRPPLVLDSLSTAADTIAAAEIDSINRNSEYHVAKAYTRARVYRSDIQGIADSITFVERDSMLYLNRKPIVWSGQRLVAGSEIAVHFNDSTADWADLPRKGLVAEAIEEGFYTQLSARKMKAFFEGEEVKQVLANTDVQTIFLPQEKDSTYNKLVNAVGDSLSIDISDRKMDKLKLWAKSGNSVSGQVTPLFSVTKQQYYLPEFISLTGASRFSEMEAALADLEKLRPTYDWYKNGWDDSLGELSFALEDYFSNPNAGISPPEETPIFYPSSSPKAESLAPESAPTPAAEVTTESAPEVAPAAAPEAAQPAESAPYEGSEQIESALE